MPVIVEAQLSTSRWQLFFDWLPLGIYVTLLLLTGYALLVPVIIVVGLWVWFSHSKSEPEFQYIRFSGDLITLWYDDNNRQTFMWSGQGWRNPFFIRWTLLDDEGLQLTCYIWKDSVSNASWRALNMAYRVQGGDD